MKEVVAIMGIILIIVGDIIFEMNWSTIWTILGFMLVSIGIIIYILIVDSLDEKKTKGNKRKKGSQQILPLK